ncbi:MAG TPA: bifunctional DNA-formamidopyrimidine glycosylase/DNA-(apurinic or apyrimidinic site) lyase [Terriglobales bacterium]|nr:bifunctional DNA-formamidopyrimidine glycosylase/DNA-(apurinic or apyrimidinic site) lyase [Terriglobales bacterium]
MPELPEVETIARGLHQRVAGDAIESVWLGAKPQTMKSPPAEIATTLEHTRIARVRRMGKHIVFELERNGLEQVSGRAGAARSSPAKSRTLQPAPGSNSQWIVHLGMTGRMLLCEPDAEVVKHTHAIVKLASGRELRFVDPRRFGRLSVARKGDFDAVGVEPLEVDQGRFLALFRGRNTPIKSALLNQKLLRGVGNIYADESLFRAGIRPRRRVSTIPRAQLERLHLAVQVVLKEAIALGGSSISDYVDADGEEGFFQLQHRVYGREGEPCLVCKTVVKRVVIVGRSSHYCPKCQK